ncbi:hypothetical protein AWB92_22860 [Mycobacterium sp. IEC1808]|nr:hypothetical protein AWB92_22860 [Mycobacterium sp. IEC1808]
MAAATAAMATAASAPAGLQREVRTTMRADRVEADAGAGLRGGVRSRVTAEEDGPRQQARSRDTDRDPTDQAQ